jgi:hypothetical protein
MLHTPNLLEKQLSLTVDSVIWLAKNEKVE